MAKDLIIDAELQAQIDQARKVGKQEQENEPHGINAWFDGKRRLIFVELRTGVLMGFPVNFLQGLENASDEQLSQVELSPSGYGLCWETLDAHLAIPELVAGMFGTKQWMAELGRKGGSVKSKAKAKSSQENGKLGGRPRKKSA